MKRPTTTYILIILIVFQIISALAGGWGLLADPTGESLGFTTEMLKHSPFNDFLIPGLFLFIVLGILPIGIVYGLIKKTSWALKTAFYFGALLILWIIIEIIFIRQFQILHLIYFLLGAAIMIVGDTKTTKKYYKVK